MFVLGNSIIGNYKLWITTPMGTVDPTHKDAHREPYFEVLLYEVSPKDGVNYYVDPTKETWLKLNLSDRNTLLKVRDKERPTDAERDFRVEYNSYCTRKEQCMPLIKLSKQHVFQLLELLFLMSKS